jgi:hypothetical protein
MKLYRNISATWGDPTIICIEDYQLQLLYYDLDERLLKEKSDGVYYNDEKIGELVEEKEDVTL